MPAVAQTVEASGPLPRGRARLARSERSLIRGALAGSEADVEVLFRRRWPRAYRAAFLIVHDHAAAEDSAQEAFVAAIRRLDRFDRRRPFAPWLGSDRCEPSDRLGQGACRPARERRSRPPAGVVSPPAGGPLLRGGAGGARGALARASRRGGDALRARVHAGGDRACVGAAARDGQLAAASWARRARIAA